MFFSIQLIFDDFSRLAGDRKVTFDVTESDLSSTVEPPDGTGDTHICLLLSKRKLLLA